MRLADLQALHDQRSKSDSEIRDFLQEQVQQVNTALHCAVSFPLSL